MWTLRRQRFCHFRALKMTRLSPSSTVPPLMAFCSSMGKLLASSRLKIIYRFLALFARDCTEVAFCTKHWISSLRMPSTIARTCWRVRFTTRRFALLWCPNLFWDGYSRVQFFVTCMQSLTFQLRPIDKNILGFMPSTGLQQQESKSRRFLLMTDIKRCCISNRSLYLLLTFFGQLDVGLCYILHFSFLVGRGSFLYGIVSMFKLLSRDSCVVCCTYQQFVTCPPITLDCTHLCTTPTLSNAGGTTAIRMKTKFISWALASVGEIFPQPHTAFAALAGSNM